MNKLDTNKCPKKSILSAIVNIGSMPLFRIAEIPLALFDPISHVFEKIWEYLFENPLTDGMGEMKDDYPKAFWISGVLWIPLMVIIYFYAIDLLFILGIARVAGLMALTIVFTILAKSMCIILKAITSGK